MTETESGEVKQAIRELKEILKEALRILRGESHE